jgi:GDPmannose 4,6-dehydratase
VTEKRALICGVTGQDGAYLARFLLGRDYRLFGTTRGDPAAGVPNLQRLGVADGVTMLRMDPVSPAEAAAAIRAAAPAEIYYLAAQSSVWRSFEAPVAAFEGSAIGLINLLEAARAEAPDARLFNAASGDCFGEAPAQAPITEQSPFRPRSPYAAAKCAGHHALAVARLAYGQFACSGFLFTHESPLRPEAFAVGKAIAAARRIAAGAGETLRLGNVDIVRDWGWAPTYVEAMWAMLQQPDPRDFVLASGESHSLAALVEQIFAALGLDWRDHVEAGAQPPRPSDIAAQHADPSAAQAALGWSGRIALDALAARLVGPPDTAS